MDYQKYNFKKIESQFIEERSIEATLYEHTPTGARFLTLDNDDQNKVFAISFRTPIENDFGIPHILEHSVLQGSKKFPLKEPFGELIKSSLATFINAYTYPDKTLYPLASTNTKDLFNLVDVYLDAVFFPLLTENGLRREGWHYEIDPKTDELIYKGVVYNEMWGAYANPDSEIFDKVFNNLFNQTPYRYDSGGNPQQIPQLEYDQVRQFHSRYYHPSNSYSVFYGNDRSEKRFAVLDEYFSQFEKKAIDSKIAIQPLGSIPKKIDESIINYADESKGTTLKAYVFSESHDMTDLYQRYIEYFYLLGTSGSPLFEKLQDSGLGDEVYNSSFDPIAQKLVVFGLKNVRLEDFDKVHTLIDQTIGEAVTKIDTSNLLASINTIEFNLRENDTGGEPQGLELFTSIMAHWLYDGDPFESMKFEEKLQNIKVYLEKPEELAANIKKYWLDYPFTSRIDLKPDAIKKQQFGDKPKQELTQKRASLSESELQEIKSTQAQLIKEQEAEDPEDVKALLPVLKIEDIDKTNELIPKEIYQLAGHETLFHNQNTSEIIYLEALFDCNHLSEELLSYLPLYSQMLSESGTKHMTKSELQFAKGTYTGGLMFTPSIYYSLSGELNLYYSVDVRCLPQYMPQSANLINEIIKSPRFDDILLLKNLINETRSGFESSLPSNGWYYTGLSVKNSLSIEGYISEKIYGISQFEFIKAIDTSNDEAIQNIISKLKQIHKLVFTNKRLKLNITTTSDSKSIAEKGLVDIVSNLAEFDSKIQNTHWNYIENWDNYAFTVPGQVNFAGVGFKLKETTGYEPSASINVVNNHLRMGFLWEKIRLIGGAYSSRNSYDAISDVFFLSSYRDPNITQTLDTYTQIGIHLKNLSLDKSELDKNIIGTIGSYSSHLLPHQKGGISFGRYLLGITDEYRQFRREEILNTTNKDINEIGEKIDDALSKKIIRVLGNKDQINKELSSNNTTIIDLLT